MSEREPVGPKGLLVLIAVLQVWLGLMVAGVYLSSHNSLHNNGNWTSTKTTLSGYLMGAFNYYFNLQALAAERLALSAWHGHQEVVLRDEVDPALVEFDFLIKDGGHLTFEFNRTDQRFTGIRLTDNELFPPVVVQATAEGRFLRKRAFKELPSRAQRRWRRLKVTFEDERRFSVFLDGRRLRTFRSGVVRPQRIGFRGSMGPAFVDNVRIVSRDGSIFTDDFSRPANWLEVKVIAVAGFLLGSTLLYLVLRRLLPIRDKYLLFYFLMVTLVLLVVSALWQGVTWHKKKFYPDATERLRAVEAAHVETGSERMIARIESRYSVEPPAGVERLLFLGSSQTRGSGAAKPGHTLVRRTEQLLNRRAGESRFECLNAAVRGYRISAMVSDFQERWVDWHPSIVILNAGNNDAGTPLASFERSLRRAAVTAQRLGAVLVLVLEPNTVELGDRKLQGVHDLTRAVAESNGLPVVDMQEALANRADEGFLWWDWVHLTSFGQRLFAEELVAELVRQGIVEF